MYYKSTSVLSYILKKSFILFINKYLLKDNTYKKRAKTSLNPCYIPIEQGSFFNGFPFAVATRVYIIL